MQKRSGDISDAFASLSGKEFMPLNARYAEIKKQLIAGKEDAVRASWVRLLATLRTEIEYIAEQGSSVVPEVKYSDVVSGQVSQQFRDELRKRGVAVVRGVVDERAALGYKASIREYIKQNPQTKAFPAENPQVFEIYWSHAQMQARTHPNMLNAQRFLMSFWHAQPDAPVSTAHPIAYADRLRIRLPGDARFALGPHMDGGSVERWEPQGYGLGGVYDAIFAGNWEAYDPWDATGRLKANMDMYQGVGACSMFRMFQGWLAMSETGPGEGTLLVNPLLALSTTYTLLRPFFSPKVPAKDPKAEIYEPEFLAADNWELELEPSAWVHGATPGHGQELRTSLHPHLDLSRSMVHVPKVRPGDYVVWHCDIIHAVDKKHAGASDSSVLYIPACPLTEENARTLARQKGCFIEGTPSPDFGGGEGESNHVGRATVENMAKYMSGDGWRALGLHAWTADDETSSAERHLLHLVNQTSGITVA